MNTFLWCLLVYHFIIALVGLVAYIKDEEWVCGSDFHFMKFLRGVVIGGFAFHFLTV